MNISVEVNIDAAQILYSRGLGSSNAAQEFLAETVERLSRPYVPLQSGTLSGSGQVSADEIKYPGPYAHYQYTGLVMGGRAPKHYTGAALQYHGGGMRGKEWDKRMMADRKGEVEQAVADFVGGEPG